MSKTLPQELGRYVLKERLAVGGMAELFLAEVAGAHGFAKTVVIKRILPHLSADEQFTAMFIAEAKITAQLAHPKIAQTFELGTVDRQLFIVMEYIEGIDVLAMLRESAHNKTRLPPEVAVYIVKEVLDALDFAHKLRDPGGNHFGIVHRDVSPSNILLSKRGNVKLVDFGIAHAATQDGQTKAGTLKGKYGYMSPEQVLAQEVSIKSDIFAAGVVLAELLMGRRLFAATNELDVLLMVRDVDLSRLSRFGKDIEEELLRLIHWALRKDPGDRYADAAAFRDALDEWLFQHRYRVTSSHVAAIVDSLFDAADARRRAGLAELDREEAPVVDERAGIPMGVARGDEDALELSVGEELVLEEAGDEGAPEEILHFEMGEPESEGTAPGQVSSGSIDIDLDEPSVDPARDFAQLSLDAEPAESTTYDNISAAVASVSPRKRDPSSRDFDDTMVSGLHTLDEGPSMRRGRAKVSSLGGIPAHRGSLSDLGALGTLYQTTAARETGKVTLSLGGTIKEIFFKRGVPEYVSSNVASELFGAYLVRMQVISAGELDMALAVMPHFGGKLGDTLVGLSLMKPLEVFRHLTRQVRSKLIEVCTWTHGDYEWFPGVKCPAQAFPLDLDPLEVYGAGAMAMPQGAINLWFDNHHQMRPVETRSSVVVPELFQVSGIRAFQQSLDGSRTIADIRRALPPNEEGLHVLRLLYLLVNTRLAVDVDDRAAKIG